MNETSSEPMIPVPTPVRPRKTGGAKIMMVILILMTLVCVILYLLSLLNSKKYYLVPEGEQLVVKKGILFPAGSERFQPVDTGLAGLYKPIDLPADFKQKDAKTFDDLPSLNREFAKYLIELARQMIFSEDESRFGIGKSYLERAGSLQGLDALQLKAIQALGADVDYLDAKRAYMSLEAILEKALRKFQQAESFGTGKFRDTGAWIEKIQVLLEAIRLTKASQKEQGTKASQNTSTAGKPRADQAGARTGQEYNVETKPNEWE